MKSRRRHELQQNVLQVELSQVWDFLRKKGNYLAWGSLVAAAIVLVVVWYVRKVRAEAQAVQTQFTRLSMMSSGPERLAGFEELAAKESHPTWAALSTVRVAGEYAMQLILRWPTLSGAERQELRRQAEAYYRRVLEKFPRQELAAAKARFGLGKLAENWGELEAARSEYQMIRQMAGLAGYPIVGAAEQALARMDQFRGRVYMPTTAEALTRPTSGPASGPATRPASGPASAPASAPSATQPAGSS